jgi:hypothetical protein
MLVIVSSIDRQWGLQLIFHMRNSDSHQQTCEKQKYICGSKSEHIFFTVKIKGNYAPGALKMLWEYAIKYIMFTQNSF